MNSRVLLLLMLVTGHLVGPGVWGPEGCAVPRKMRAPASCPCGESVMVSNHGLHPQTWGWGSGLLGVPEALMTGTGPSSWWIPWRDLPPAGWDFGGV